MAIGCGDDVTEVDGGGFDAALPDSGGPIGVPCTDDSDCGDGIECTQDVCDASGICRNLPDPGICQDGVFCNGVEICDLESGCEPGDAACNDDDVCTVPACDEEERQCRQLPRDADGDGEADWHCPGGTDCDDRDPTRGMSFSELCAMMWWTMIATIRSTRWGAVGPTTTSARTRWTCPPRVHSPSTPPARLPTILPLAPEPVATL